MVGAVGSMVGEWRGGMEMDPSAWQGKIGGLTEKKRVWRQPGEPSQAGNSTLDLF